MGDSENVFGVVDYIVFLGMLGVSSGIGIFYAIKGQKSTADILVGGKTMSVLPVAASIMATFMSAAGLLGLPAEQFLYGSQLILSNTFITMPLLTLMSSYFIVPVFYELGMCSANEYLERRFGRPIRGLACILYCLTMIFYMGVSLFAPAMALTQVTGLPAWVTIWTTGLVCTFYTTIGGMKAVVWTDAFQSLIMLVAMVWIVIKGVMDTGGVVQVWNDNWETGRIELTNFDPNPYVRVTFWNTILGGTIALIGAYGTNQATIQRYLSLPTLRDAQKTVWAALPMFTVINVLTLALSMVVVSKYRYCDPIKTKRVQAADQLFPLFVMDTMGSIPGIPGIFVAGIFSASLSTVSSGINSITAVVLEDVVKTYLYPRITEEQSIKTIKVLSVVFGVGCIGAATIAGRMGNIVQASMFVFGLLGAPMFGAFMLGLFVPYATNLGATIGLICGFAFNLWMGIGAFLNFPFYPTKEQSYVEGCPDLYFNVTGQHFNLTANNAIVQMQLDRTEDIFPIFRISFMYFMLVGVTVVILVGTIISFLTGATDIDSLDTRLCVPPVRRALERRRKRLADKKAGLTEGIAMLSGYPGADENGNGINGYKKQ